MADIIHERVVEEPRRTDSGMGFLWGLVLLVILVILFFYGLPYIRNLASGPQINVPSKIDVNIKK